MIQVGNNWYSDDALEKKVKDLELQLSEVPKKVLAAVNAEQLRCGKIAEAFWNKEDKLNADLRVKLTQAEKSMAYMISTNIRAMRWQESNFTEKRFGEGGPGAPGGGGDLNGGAGGRGA